MNKFIFVFIVLFATPLFGSIMLPDKCDCPDGVCPVSVFSMQVSGGIIDTVTATMDAIKLDASNLTKANNDKNAAQKLLDQANADIKTYSDKLATDRVNLNKLLDDINNNKPAPKQKVIELVEIASSTCDPCNKMQPIVDELSKNGVNIRRLNTDKETCPYAHSVTPTWIMLVDGKEVSRAEGMYDKKRLQAWWEEMVIWAKK